MARRELCVNYAELKILFDSIYWVRKSYILMKNIMAGIIIF